MNANERNKKKLHELIICYAVLVCLRLVFLQFCECGVCFLQQLRYCLLHEPTNGHTHAIRNKVDN